MNKEQEGLIELVGQEYTKWFYDNAVPSVSGKPILNGEGILTKGGFMNKCKTDTEFSEKWGLKIEERELSLEERFNIKYPGGRFSIFQENFPNTHKRNNPNDLLDAFDIPTKLITITYNDKTIESYE
jgi:hypothetical protein